jgi:hypothetical protein
VGESGSGKTSLVATLANAGYKLRILDLDNNLAVMKSKFTGDAANNVIAEPVFARDPDSWNKLTTMVENWKTSTEDLGAVKDWDSNTVLVVDSGTFACDVCLNKVLKDNKVPLDKGNFDQSLWGVMAKRYEDWIAVVTSDRFTCHVVVTAHLTERQDNKGILRTSPYFLGKQLPKKLPSYFNNTWAVDIDRDNKRKLITQSTGFLGALRSSAPHVLKPEEVMDLGVLFKKIEAA